MAFTLDCPCCHKAVTVSEELGGNIMACPYCAGHFRLAAKGTGPIPVATATQRPTAVPSMARFTFSCQRCGSVLESRRDLCGEAGGCPTCGAVFTVPQVDAKTGQAAGPAVVADDGQLPTPMHAYATAGAKAPEIRRLESGDQVIICPRCRRQMPVDAETCSACGIPFTIEGASSIAQAGPESNGYATAAMTVGILAVLSPCLPILGPVAIGLGIAGLRRAEKIKTANSGRKLAIAGIICGVVSLGLFALICIL